MPDQPKGPFFPFDNPGQSQVKPWSLDAQKLFFHKIDLTVARQNDEIKIGGDFIWCTESFSNASNCRVTFSEGSGHQHGLLIKRGTSLSGIKFSSLFVTNDAQTSGEFLILMYGREIGTDLDVNNFPAELGSLVISSITNAIKVDDRHRTENDSAFIMTSAQGTSFTRNQFRNISGSTLAIESLKVGCFNATPHDFDIEFGNTAAALATLLNATCYDKIDGDANTGILEHRTAAGAAATANSDSGVWLESGWFEIIDKSPMYLLNNENILITTLSATNNFKFKIEGSVVS